MKKLTLTYIVAIMVTFVALADDPFVLKNENDYSYISFTEDLSKFGFTITDRGGPNDMIGAMYIDENGNKTDFGILKDFSNYEYGDISKDGSIQFYLGNSMSSEQTYSLMKNDDGTYKIMFKNVNQTGYPGNYNPGYYQGNHKGNGYGHNNGNGGGKWGNGANIYDYMYAGDVWIDIGEIRVTYADDRDIVKGMPLPGFWPAIIISILFLGFILYLRKKSIIA